LCKFQVKINNFEVLAIFKVCFLDSGLLFLRFLPNFLRKPLYSSVAQGRLLDFLLSLIFYSISTCVAHFLTPWESVVSLRVRNDEPLKMNCRRFLLEQIRSAREYTTKNVPVVHNAGLEWRILLSNVTLVVFLWKKNGRCGGARSSRKDHSILVLLTLNWNGASMWHGIICLRSNKIRKN
jgi:hypothetical protein